MAVTLTNNLNLWDSQKTNYTTSANLVSDSQRLNGFQQSEYLKSATFNGFFMELSLVTLSVIDALASLASTASVSLTVNNDTTRADLSAAIKAILEGLSVHYAETTGAATSATQAANLASGAKGSIPYQSAANTTAFLAKGTQGQILAQGANDTPTWINPGTLAVQSAATAATATTATNVGNLTNDDTGANTTIAFSIGNKSYSKTITVAIPGTVASAETVTANIQINGTNKAISTLFENNGDAKKATYATSAGTATSATNASYATTAGTVGTANTAAIVTDAIRIGNNDVLINSLFNADGSVDSAYHASIADSSDYASSAGSASYADTAGTTDFTNSTWTAVGINSSVQLPGYMATYEVQVGFGTNWYSVGMMTINVAIGSTPMLYRALCFGDAPTKYCLVEYSEATGMLGVTLNSSWSPTSWRYRRIK